MTTEFINAHATDLSNVAKGHNIGEKFADLLNAQIMRLITNKIFVREADYIKKTCEKNNLSRIVDFGCWTGVLASEIFNTDIKIDNYHLIDASPFYINCAKTMLDGKPITSECVTLIPPSFKQPNPTSMLVHPYDTLNSSSIYSRFFLSEEVKNANVTVPISNPTPLNDFLKSNKNLFSDSCYVKIDLDGVDIELVRGIFEHCYLPGAIQFEVWHSFKGGASKLFEIFKMNGYKVPNVNLNIHQNYSVGLSRDFWWAVGYDNVSTKPEATYYDSDY